MALNAQRYLLDSFRYAQKRYFAHNEELPDPVESMESLESAEVPEAEEEEKDE